MKPAPTIFAASDTGRTLREGTYRGYYSSVVSEATERHEQREARENTAYAGLWRNIVRRAIARAHCGIDVPDMAHDTRAVY